MARPQKNGAAKEVITDGLRRLDWGSQGAKIARQPGWAKGPRGNPYPKPKGRVSPLQVMRRLSNQLKTGQDRIYAEIIVLKLLELCCSGNLAAIRLWLEYLEGKPVERVVHASVRGWSARVNLPGQSVVPADEDEIL